MSITSPPNSGYSLDLALLRGAVEELPLGVATTRSGSILYANSALERIYSAAPGSLDNKPIGVLLEEETLTLVRGQLETVRVFDGRVRSRALDGRAITLELHAERYQSASGVIGGFLLVRDVTFELGALARLIDLLGGALFRIRIEDAFIEHVSPAIEGLIGISAASCVAEPRKLKALVEGGDRDRLAAMYARLARGETMTESAEISLRLPDRTKGVVLIHATGRRDATGLVGHIDGVVTDATANRTSTVPPPPLSSDKAEEASKALLLLAGHLLREVGFLTHAGTTTARRVRGAAQTLRASVPAAAVQELTDASDNLLRSLGAASALNRRVRRALDGRITRGALIDVLENVRSSLAPLVSEHAITIEPGNGGRAVFQAPLDALTLALTHLGLRAFRLAGGGSLRLEAHREDREVIVDIVGEPGGETTVGGSEPDSGSVPAQVGPADMEAQHRAVSAVLATMGGTLDEDVSLDGARTRVRLKIS